MAVRGAVCKRGRGGAKAGGPRPLPESPALPSGLAGLDGQPLVYPTEGVVYFNYVRTAKKNG